MGRSRSALSRLALWVLCIAGRCPPAKAGTAASEVLFDFPLTVDGNERHILLKPGVPVAEVVRTFLSENRVDRSHEGMIIQEIRRKLNEADPQLLSRAHPDDRVDMFIMAVDVGSGRPENVSFVLDGREELQVLQFCSSRQQGPVCVASILKSIAQQYEHRRMMREVQQDALLPQLSASEGTELGATKTSSPPQMALKVVVNGESMAVLGYPGQSVTAVVDSFMTQHSIPLAFKKALTNEVVDAVLGLTDPDPLALNFHADGTPLDITTAAGAPSGGLRPWMTALQPLPPVRAEKAMAEQPEVEASALQEQVEDSKAQVTVDETESRPEPAVKHQGKVYVVDMHVNQESRPLVMQQGQDIAAVARDWCYQQGTQEAEHISYVQSVIEQSIREQDLKDDLSVYQDRVDTELEPLRSGQELLSFIPRDGNPPVTIYAGRTPMQMSEEWCQKHDIKASEVTLLAQLIVQQYDAWAKTQAETAVETLNTPAMPTTRKTAVLYLLLGLVTLGSMFLSVCRLVTSRAAGAQLQSKAKQT